MVWLFWTCCLRCRPSSAITWRRPSPPVFLEIYNSAPIMRSNLYGLFHALIHIPPSEVIFFPSLFPTQGAGRALWPVVTDSVECQVDVREKVPHVCPLARPQNGSFHMRKPVSRDQVLAHAPYFSPCMGGCIPHARVHRQAAQPACERDRPGYLRRVYNYNLGTHIFGASAATPNHPSVRPRPARTLLPWRYHVHVLLR